ncbi:hypothetical protein BCR33DRAFT_139031 [Rhizoclosmatium globosum]|uniref:F-box domain-containing protein n=1 Tax=Rhizoclosmatium globosum TaxID=329046 RepID=A0A1Y2AKH1_9FUNG|nr:hypothetical protein BCR33DRAFT_139031 [Rhizoclosmatium globosum]|eukprot:ORY22994.1 hypothetical protein BCR33DRAFT_139031 [Rhizoclosmatium globosum]
MRCASKHENSNPNPTSFPLPFLGLPCASIKMNAAPHLYLEIWSQILSFLDPNFVMRLRNLNRVFDSVLTSTTFWLTALNKSQRAIHAEGAYIPSTFDRMWLITSTVYGTQYVGRNMRCLQAWLAKRMLKRFIRTVHSRV